MLENLPYRDRRILELRYGLRGEQPQTLDKVAKLFGLTRERTRQVEDAALRKLSTLSRRAGAPRRRLAPAPTQPAPARGTARRLHCRAVPVNTDAKGKSFPPFEYEVGKEKIREYAHAVGEDNPVYFDREAAKAAGFRDVAGAADVRGRLLQPAPSRRRCSTPRSGSTSR